MAKLISQEIYCYADDDCRIIDRETFKVVVEKNNEYIQITKLDSEGIQTWLFRKETAKEISEIMKELSND